MVTSKKDSQKAESKPTKTQVITKTTTPKVVIETKTLSKQTDSDKSCPCQHKAKHTILKIIITLFSIVNFLLLLSILCFVAK